MHGETVKFSSLYIQTQYRMWLIPRLPWLKFFVSSVIE